MPKFNADSTPQEPIEVTLNGKTYVIPKITVSQLDEVKKLSEKSKDASALLSQLAIFLGVDVVELKGSDIRDVGRVSQFIFDEITKSFGPNQGK